MYARRKRTKNRTTDTDANMESNISDAPNDKKNAKGLYTPCSISFHHIRKRLADVDGLSSKAAIDGLVHAKILQDDSPKHVKEVTHSQEKGESEYTVITIRKI